MNHTLPCLLAMILIPNVLTSGSGAPSSAREIRPELNGTRVRAPGTATVYLIDNGFLRAIPHVAAYEALFRDWECIAEDIDVESIRLGDPMSESPGLVRQIGEPGVYLVDGTTRRHVASTQVMDKYHFAWEKVREVSSDEMKRWTEGPKLR